MYIMFACLWTCDINLTNNRVFILHKNLFLISNNRILVVKNSFSVIKKYFGIFLYHKFDFLYQKFEFLLSENPVHFLILKYNFISDIRNSFLQKMIFLSRKNQTDFVMHLVVMIHFSK